MGDADTGAAVKVRRNRLGLSASVLAARAGIDRATLRTYEDGTGKTRDATVAAVEKALAELEEEMGFSPLREHETPDDLDMVEFHVAGNFGVDVVVKGPVRDRKALEESVLRLVAQMQGRKPPS
jgi:transcriptional regulator with XRE-family HTH domain